MCAYVGMSYEVEMMHAVVDGFGRAWILGALDDFNRHVCIRASSACGRGEPGKITGTWRGLHLA